MMGLLLFVLSGCGGSAITQPQYIQRIVESSPVPGLVVGVEHLETVFWGVGVRNDTGEAVRLIWDESAYVSSDGTSSRLIRANTRVIDAGQAQPATPVPPGARISEAFTAEQWVEYARYAVTPQPADPNATARMYLVFDVKGQRVGWQGEVSFVRVQ